MELFPISAPAFDGHSRVVEAGNAFEWLKQGWALFMAKPGIWIATTILFFAMVLGLSIVPLVGALAVNLLAPLLVAGLLLACQKLSNGETPEIVDLFAGFQRNTGNLVMLGVLYMAAMLVVIAVVFFLGGGSVAGGLMMGSPLGVGLALGGMMFAMLISVALSVPLIMAAWFAPALVFFNNMPPGDALRASFDACLKNALPFLVYGLVVMVLAFFAALPVGLGFLVLVPVLAGSLYVSYRDIFVAN